jgi:hypothetical protein
LLWVVSVMVRNNRLTLQNVRLNASHFDLSAHISYKADFKILLISSTIALASSRLISASR